MTGTLTTQQIMRMLTPRPENIFESKQRMTYIPAHEVKAELSRIFGPGGWDHTIHEVTCLYDREVNQGDPGYPAKGDGKPYYIVGYRLACTLRIRDFEGAPVAETTEYHAEENAPLPNRGEAHAMALTSCESYALRRAALDFGDAFGLHLYDGGSTMPLVKGSLALTEARKGSYDQIMEERKKAAQEAEERVQARMKHATPRTDAVIEEAKTEPSVEEAQ